jgi:hypothetical protein
LLFLKPTLLSEIDGRAAEGDIVNIAKVAAWFFYDIERFEQPSIKKNAAKH